jgi:hypothetical protein
MEQPTYFLFFVFFIERSQTRSSAELAVVAFYRRDRINVTDTSWDSRIGAEAQTSVEVDGWTGVSET